jgi:hypothetical protein
MHLFQHSHRLKISAEVFKEAKGCSALLAINDR